MTITKALVAMIALALALSAASPSYAKPCGKNATNCQTVFQGSKTTIYGYDNGKYYECQNNGGGCKQL